MAISEIASPLWGSQRLRRIASSPEPALSIVEGAPRNDTCRPMYPALNCFGILSEFYSGTFLTDHSAGLGATAAPSHFLSFKPLKRQLRLPALRLPPILDTALS